MWWEQQIPVPIRGVIYQTVSSLIVYENDAKVLKRDLSQPRVHLLWGERAQRCRKTFVKAVSDSLQTMPEQELRRRLNELLAALRDLLLDAETRGSFVASLESSVPVVFLVLRMHRIRRSKDVWITSLRRIVDSQETSRLMTDQIPISLEAELDNSPHLITGLLKYAESGL